jgi:transcriptional regulator with XRE-family HTH domain
MGDVVAVLLDDAMPPERRGRLLRAARKRKNWKRSQAAAKAGVTPDELRAYERGTIEIPAAVCARVAEIYGAALSDHVPMRVPVVANEDWLVVGEYEQPLMAGTPEEILAGYVKIIQRLRKAKPGEPLPLRAADVGVLAHACQADRDEIETQIAAALGCTREEARKLHNELLRRKVILPVAGLAAGVVALGGLAYASQSASAASAPPAPAPHVAVVPGGHGAPQPVVHHVAPVLHQAPIMPATPATVVPVPTPKPAAPTAAAAPAPAPAPVAAHPHESAAPLHLPNPVPDPNGTVSVLPGEGPFVVIGDADTKIAEP